MKLDKHPLAVNVLKFQYYNFDFFSCQEIVLFETLVVVGGISFKKKDEFFHSTQTLSDKTGIKKHSINKIIKRFDELNIINIKVKGMPRVKFFILNWDQIIELLPQIYQFDEVEEYFGGSTQPFIDYYKQLAENNEKIPENNEEKNIIKNNTEEYEKKIKKENQENAIAEDEENAVIFFLEELKAIFRNRIEQYNRDNEDYKDYVSLTIKNSVIKKILLF